ncbi:MAG TPA: SPOR domain-containing protein [Burkholderiales bacterium]|nr:SPOR domain-containing protein [Burkholderiales bacterium]
MPKPLRTRQAVRRKSGGSFLLGLFVGVVLGLGIALAVAYYLNKTPIPFIEKTKPGFQGEAPLTPQAPPPSAGMPPGGAANAQGAPGEAPKFDFYKILPGSGEAPVTEQGASKGTGAAKPQSAAAAELYYIQTGSFQNPAEADNQKAKLALLGLDSSIEPTSVPDKGTWYRVRLGPYTKLEDINRVRQQLAQNGFNPSLVKLKPGASGATN